MRFEEHRLPLRLTKRMRPQTTATEDRPSNRLTRVCLLLLPLLLAPACGDGGGASAPAPVSTAPLIIRHPAAATVVEGQSADFTVQASGTEPLAYQWRRDASPIPGATSASYRIASAAVSDDGARFSVVVNNAAGSVTSQEAVLTVQAAPAGPPFAFRLGATGADFAKDICADTEGNVLVTGYFSRTVDFDPGPGASNLTSGGATDVFLAKYGSSGRLLWVRGFSGTGIDMPHTVKVNAVGQPTVVGYFSDTVNFNPDGQGGSRTSQGGRDAFIVQYEPDGRFRWAVTYGGAGDDDATDLVFDAENRVHLTGSFAGQVNLDPRGRALFSSAGGTDMLLAVYDGEGRYDSALRIGGAGQDAGYAIALAGVQLVVGGTFQGRVDFGAGTSGRTLNSRGSSDIFLARFHVSHVFQSVLTIGGTGFDLLAPGGVDLNADGWVVATGSIQATASFDATMQRSSNGDDDLFLASYDAADRVNWVMTAGGTGGDRGHRCKFDAAGSVVLAGWWRGSANFDPRGSYVLTATASNQGSDVLLAKYSRDGSLLWAEGFGGGAGDGTPQSEAAWNLAAGMGLDPAGNILLAGKFFTTVDFDPSAASLPLTSGGEADAFIAKYGSNGQLGERRAVSEAAALASGRWFLADRS